MGSDATYEKLPKFRSSVIIPPERGWGRSACIARCLPLALRHDPFRPPRSPAKLPKQLDLARDVERTHNAVPGLIVAKWVKGHA